MSYIIESQGIENNFDGVPVEIYQVVHEQSGVGIKKVSSIAYAQMLVEELNKPETRFDKFKSKSDWTKEAQKKVYQVAYQQLYVRFFASGLGERIELESFYVAGENLGVRATNLNKGKSWTIMSKGLKTFLKNLGNMQNYHGYLFIDSGAFQEYNMKTKAYNKPEMDKAVFESAFNLYAEMAQIWGDRLYIVAPDKVANQTETLKRMKPFISKLAKLREQTGVNVIIPLQAGSKYTLTQFHDVVNKLCKKVNMSWVRGIPATAKSPKALEQFGDLLDARNFNDCHLLGMSPRNAAFPDVEKLILEKGKTWMTITMDGAIIRSLVGKSAKLTNLLKAIQDLFTGNLNTLIDDLWQYQGRSRSFEQMDDSGGIAIPYDDYGQVLIDMNPKTGSNTLSVRKSFVQTLLAKNYQQYFVQHPPDKWLKGSFKQKRKIAGKMKTFTYYNVEFMVFWPIDTDIVVLLEDWLDSGQSDYNNEQIEQLKRRMNEDYYTDDGDDIPDAPPIKDWSNIKWDTIRDLYGEFLYSGINTDHLTTLATQNDRYHLSPFFDDLMLARKLDNMLFWYWQQEGLKSGQHPSLRQFSYPLSFLKILDDDGVLAGRETYN